MKGLLSLLPHQGLRLQTLYLALLPKLVDRSAEQHQLMWVWLPLPVHGGTIQHETELVAQPLPVVRCDWWW